MKITYALAIIFVTVGLYLRRVFFAFYLFTYKGLDKKRDYFLFGHHNGLFHRANYCPVGEPVLSSCVGRKKKAGCICSHLAGNCQCVFPDHSYALHILFQ